MSSGFNESPYLKVRKELRKTADTWPHTWLRYTHTYTRAHAYTQMRTHTHLHNFHLNAYAHPTYAHTLTHMHAHASTHTHTNFKKESSFLVQLLSFKLFLFACCRSWQRKWPYHFPNAVFYLKWASIEHHLWSPLAVLWSLLKVKFIELSFLRTPPPQSLFCCTWWNSAKLRFVPSLIFTRLL